MVWLAKDYLKANYFQTELNLAFLRDLPVTPFGNILDIGCGDGYTSHQLASDYPDCHVTAIDNSEDMIAHARHHFSRSNLQFEVEDSESFHSDFLFDCIFSFWCLHWTNIAYSFKTIYQSLKPSGKAFLILSSFTDNSIFQTWDRLSKMDDTLAVFDQLHFKASTGGKGYFFDVVNEIYKLPFRKVKMFVGTKRIKLPDLNYFRDLILAMPFAKRVPEEELDTVIDQMTIAFYDICKSKYNGELYYETRPIYVEALK